MILPNHHTPNPSHPGHCYVGLDLGQRLGHTAICAIEHRLLPTGQRNFETYQFLQERELRVCLLERHPLGTSYVRVAAHIRALLQRPQFAGRSTLIVDASGPGLPFVDFLSAQGVGANLVKVLITSSGKPHWSAGFDHVSRQALIANLVLMIQKGDFRVDPDLPEAKTLREELRGLKLNGDAKGRDDLVMAAALAAWQLAKRAR